MLLGGAMVPWIIAEPQKTIKGGIGVKMRPVFLKFWHQIAFQK